MKSKPSPKDVAKELGDALNVWDQILSSISRALGGVEQDWKPSKSDFGWMCLLKHKKRTILYLTPEAGSIRVAIVLGERAVELALASRLPAKIKRMIREARPYAEGRGIRFPVSSESDLPVVSELIAIKTTPK